jgi:hypothetical protein
MEDALRRAKMSVQPLKTSDTLACPGTPRCPPILKSSKPVRRCPLARSRRVLVRSRATVEARPTPSGKPRHARSPDRLPVNFSPPVSPLEIGFPFVSPLSPLSPLEELPPR